ncbi:MAG: hypothetical protein JXR51_08550 [Bacteroidales bacterium]|nr:hypothetical protein [Bacteroidales bacterium]MBN2757212.1 hypothetical protein [Bacteroidales bacterium]
MDIKKNIKLINSKESALIYVLLIPLLLVLFIPAIAIFMIRGFFKVILSNGNSNDAVRRPPEF